MNSLSDLAQWAVSASWAAALPALVLLALGEWRNFPVRWRWLLSLAVAVRLAVPMVPAITWHPLTLLHAPHPAVATATASEAQVSAAVSPWTWVWLAGFAAVAMWLAASQILLWRKVRQLGSTPGTLLKDIAASCMRQAEVRSKVELRMVPGLTTPAVFGIWRPRLLLPEDIEAMHSPSETRGILLHELQHIRSRDALWTWLGLILCALHWFNPLAWLCLRRFRADRELMCDARTLEQLSPRQRTAYGQALLKTWETVGRRQPALLTPFLRRNSATYHRILMSLQPTKPHRLAHLLAILLVPALSLFSLTTLRADGDQPKKPGEAQEATKDGEGSKPGKKKKSKRTRGEGEGEGARKGSREGDKPSAEGDKGKKPGEGDGAKKTGPRDGEGSRKSGPRDGEGAAKTGPRDGEGSKKAGPREGDKN